MLPTIGVGPTLPQRNIVLPTNDAGVCSGPEGFSVGASHGLTPGVAIILQTPTVSQLEVACHTLTFLHSSMTVMVVAGALDSEQP